LKIEKLPIEFETDMNGTNTSVNQAGIVINQWQLLKKAKFLFFLSQNVCVY